jgi:hypothetical protein
VRPEREKKRKKEREREIGREREIESKSLRYPQSKAISFLHFDPIE